MSREEIEKRVLEIVLDQTGLRDVRLSDTLEDLHGDSLDAVELVIAVEEEFNIKIPDGEMSDARYSTFTIKDAIDYIEAAQR